MEDTKRVQARLISKGKDGKSAEVVVCLGGGMQKRSVTRHLRPEKGVWIGYNPDEAAVARLDAAELGERRAQEFYERIAPFAELELPKLNEFLDCIKEHKAKVSGVPASVFTIAARMLIDEQELKAKDLKSAIEADVAEALTAATTTHKEAGELRAVTPRLVEFVFSLIQGQKRAHTHV